MKKITFGIGLVLLILPLFPFTVGSSWAGVIPRTNWRVWYVDSEETVGENGVAENAFDGVPGTLWHTQWVGSPDPPPPHEIQIDLRGTYNINGFRYLPRQDGQVNGTIRGYEFYVSADGLNWGSPVASGNFANNLSEKEVVFTAKTGQFVRLRALSEVNGNPWTSVDELNVLENALPGNQAPNGVIDAPVQNMTINAGDFVTFTGTGTDPDGNLPLSFRWNFGAGSGIPDATVEDPGAKQFTIAGVFTVTFTVTDAQGLPDPTPATRVVTVLGGGGAGVIPRTNWRVWYVDSEETVGENGVAENAFDGVPGTLWHTQWVGSPDPPPPHEIQIDLRGTYNINGFRYLPRQDGQVNGTIRGYEFYVSADGLNWGSPVASGNFANNLSEKEVVFTAKTGQFVRLRALSEVNGNPWTSVDELNVLGDGTSTGDYYVAVGDSITRGSHDDFPADDTSLDGRNTGGGYEPILNDLLTGANGYPHTVVNEGVSGHTASDGLTLIPTILANHPAAKFFLVQYGTNDAGYPFASGLGLNPGNPGYNGSYKDYMQQIITAIAAEGKEAFLAKVPIILPEGNPKNVWIQEYNAVIDELLAVNGITVVPPDFYTYFRNHPEQLDDDKHPNGVGYQSMASLWFTALTQ